MNDEFLELLDNYLDLEEMELKKQLDQDEINKKQFFTNTVFNIEDSISISKYVHDYLNIDGDCSNLLHCGLKDLGCKYIIGVDNNFANKNPEFVYKGYLLLVIDAHHNRGTYINPVYLKQLLEKDTIEKEFKLFIKKRMDDLKKLDEYYKKYIDLRNQIDSNEKFYRVLEEAHKVKKVKILIKERNDKND